MREMLKIGTGTSPLPGARGRFTSLRVGPFRESISPEAQGCPVGIRPGGSDVQDPRVARLFSLAHAGWAAPSRCSRAALGARLEHQRRQLQHRRRDRELAGRRRRRDDAVLRPGHVRRGQLHDLGDPGRNAGRRRLDQHGDQGRRQRVDGQRALQLRQRQPAVRELGRHRRRVSRRRSSATRPRRPTTSTCPAAAPSSRTGCGSTAPIRKWVVNKLVNATNADGSQALDDNDLKNYSGKVVGADHGQPQDDRLRTCGTTRSAAIAATAPNNDSRHRRRSCRPTRCRRRRRNTPASRPAWCYESNFSVMDGQTNYTYQPDTAADAIRMRRHQLSHGRLRLDARRAPAELAPPVRQHRVLRQVRLGRRAPVQGRRAVGPLYYASDYSVQRRSLVESTTTACRRRFASSTRRRSRRTWPRSPASSSRTRGR